MYSYTNVLIKKPKMKHLSWSSHRYWAFFFNIFLKIVARSYTHFLTHNTHRNSYKAISRRTQQTNRERRDRRRAFTWRRLTECVCVYVRLCMGVCAVHTHSAPPLRRRVAGAKIQWGRYVNRTQRRCTFTHTHATTPHILYMSIYCTRTLRRC